MTKTTLKALQTDDFRKTCDFVCTENLEANNKLNQNTIKKKKNEKRQNKMSKQ